jgi:hypothetical protein
MLSSGSEKYIGRAYVRLVQFTQSGFMYMIMTILFQEMWAVMKAVIKKKTINHN